MPEDGERFPGLGTAYIGPNRAHVALVESLSNAKALAFVLYGEEPLKEFYEEVEAARAMSPDGRFALGRVGRATTTTVQLALHLRHNEIDLIESAPGGTRAQLVALIYREFYRAFETYLVELFEEITHAEPRILHGFSGKLTYSDAIEAADAGGVVKLMIEREKARLTRGGLRGFEEAFAAMGLPLLPQDGEAGSPDELRDRLLLGASNRNLIEHASSTVNEEYRKLVPGSVLGERIEIGTPELGDLDAVVECVTSDLNRRAVEKFGLGSTSPEGGESGA